MDAICDYSWMRQDLSWVLVLSLSLSYLLILLIASLFIQYVWILSPIIELIGRIMPGRKARK